MSKRFDNRRLLYILGGLIVILAFTILVKIPKESSTLRDKIVDFDSTEVAKIMLYPKITAGKPFEFLRKDGKWIVRQEKIESAARKYEVENIMIELMSVKPQNLVSKNKSKWAEYEVSDSTGTRIKFLNSKDKVLSDVIVGKFTYKQLNNQMSMYGRNNIQGTSYVRVTREDEVFGVEGFLALSFNRSFNDWRDNSLISFNMDDITSIKYTYPADSSFVLSKKDSKWMVDSAPADSAETVSYVSSLSTMTGQEFNDTFKPVVNPDYQINIEGNNLLNISVKCYRQPDGSFIINSSQNPDIYFNSKPEGIFGKIFKPKKQLI
jgi:hypothetical protein